MTHSKTPWRPFDDFYIDGNPGEHVAEFVSESNRDHVIACVNAIGECDPEKLAAFIEAAKAVALEYEEVAVSDKHLSRFFSAIRELRGEQ